MENKRIIYFDYLRVFAIAAVIVLHVSAQNYYSFTGRTLQWNVFNAYNSLSRWGVPVFTMISGSLFLSKDLNVRKIYSKNILRMLVVYVIWSIFYALTMPIFKNGMLELSFKTIIENIIKGCYHMWFIPMIIGMYMCVPIIKRFIDSEYVVKYYLILAFVFSFLLPQILNMSYDFIGGTFAAGINAINGFADKMEMGIVKGSITYFILGYWLGKTEFNKKQRKVIYILGVVGFLSTILLNAIMAWKLNQPHSTYHQNCSVNVLLASIAVFVWFKYNTGKNYRINNIILKLSKYSFGVYLVHPIIIEILESIGVDTVLCSPIISVPLVSLFTIVISNIISLILNKIPKINKWIV